MEQFLIPPCLYLTHTPSSNLKVTLLPTYSLSFLSHTCIYTHIHTHSHTTRHTHPISQDNKARLCPTSHSLHSAYSIIAMDWPCHGYTQHTFRRLHPYTSIFMIYSTSKCTAAQRHTAKRRGECRQY